MVSVATSQACDSVTGYRRLWCGGFRGFGLPGSLAPLVTLLKVVRFCGFFFFGCAPPGPAFCGLGWPSVTRLGFAHPGVTGVSLWVTLPVFSPPPRQGWTGLSFVWVPFLVAHPGVFPARQGLTPLGVFLCRVVPSPCLGDALFRVLLL